MTDDLLTLQQVADELQVPLSTVYSWRSQHIGPAGVKLGRHVRVRRSALEAWVAEHADLPSVPRPRKKKKAGAAA